MDRKEFSLLVFSLRKSCCKIVRKEESEAAECALCLDFIFHVFGLWLSNRVWISHAADDGTPADLIKWHTPNLEGLEKFLALHLYWEPHYVRQRVLPLLSHTCLKAMALREGSEQRPSAVESTEEMINGLFTPHSIERIKVDHFKPYYMLRWQCLAGHPSDDEWLGVGRKNSQSFKRDELEQEQVGLDDDANACTINVETGDLGGQCVFTTNENMELVKEACPKLVEAFLQDQVRKKLYVVSWSFEVGVMLLGQSISE